MKKSYLFRVLALGLAFALPTLLSAQDTKTGSFSKENYIIDKDWVYFIDKFSRRVKVESTESRLNTIYGLEVYGAAKPVYKDEIYYCLCRIRLNASEPEETVFENVNERSFININDGMIYFLDSKYNQKNILLPR